jgi:hypothetical protein
VSAPTQHTTSENQPMTATSSPLTTADLATVSQLARQLRVDSIRASTSAGSGHPTSSMSAADLLAVLVARHLQYDWEHPNGHPLYRYSGDAKPGGTNGQRVTAFGAAWFAVSGAGQVVSRPASKPGDRNIY